MPTGLLRPAFAAVIAHIHATIASFGFNQRINAVWICFGNGNRYSPQISGRNSAVYFSPGFSAIGAFVYGALRTSAQVGPFMAPALVKGGVDHIGISGVEMHLITACVVANMQYSGP